ncbi:MAG: hypothetical protein QM755_02745 [Luteolibacter sp.]
MERVWQVGRGEAGTGRAHDRSAALICLLKAGTPVAEILPAMPRKRDDQRFGPLILLRGEELRRHLKFSDLPVVFSYLDQLPALSAYSFRREGVGRSVYLWLLAHLEDEAVLQEFLRHWWSPEGFYIRECANIFKDEIAALPKTLRHRLVSLLMDSEEFPNKGAGVEKLIMEEDLEWLVAKLAEESEPLRRSWMLEEIEQRWECATSEGVPAWLEEAYAHAGEDFRMCFPYSDRRGTLAQKVARYHAEGERERRRYNRWYRRAYRAWDREVRSRKYNKQIQRSRRFMEWRFRMLRAKSEVEYLPGQSRLGYYVRVWKHMLTRSGKDD